MLPHDVLGSRWYLLPTSLSSAFWFFNDTPGFNSLSFRIFCVLAPPPRTDQAAKTWPCRRRGQWRKSTAGEAGCSALQCGVGGVLRKRSMYIRQWGEVDRQKEFVQALTQHHNPSALGEIPHPCSTTSAGIPPPVLQLPEKTKGSNFSPLVSFS